MMVRLELRERDGDPLYRQIYAQLRDAILEGRLPPGSKLPPTRSLADEHGIGRLTAIQAYDQLEAEGYVEARRGAGTFVAEDLPALTEEDGENGRFVPELSQWGRRVKTFGDRYQPASDARGGHAHFDVDFGFGRSFPHIFPYGVWRRLLARYLSTDDAMLSRYGSVSGFQPLREAIADYVQRLRGVTCTTEQVVVVNGVQQALDLLARLLLDEGDEVLVETPGYTDAFALFRVHGARLRALPVDEQGFPVEAIPADSQARVAFVTPAHQFPKGGAMPLARRLALLQWAREADALVIEDDYDGALRYEERPLAALQGLDEEGRVIYLGTFSKVLFPALRLGYVILPPALLQPFVRGKAIVDRGAPTLTQAAVADFIVEGHFERHLRRLRKAYGERRETLIEALERLIPGDTHFSREPAGLHVMLYLDPTCDEEEVVRRTAAAGVRVYPGATYHLEPDPPPSVLLGFSGLRPEEIVEGVRRLAAVLAQR